jgi:hypothetical protein
MSEVIGKVILVGNTEEVGQNGFTKRVIVVETAEQYPQKLAIDFVKDKTSLLDKFKVGDNVNVGVNLRGSEYNGRYFVNLQGWKISKLSENDVKSVEVVSAEVIKPAEIESDLPF